MTASARVIGTEPLFPGASVAWDLIDAPITSLGDAEVLVFGSNSTGFHGAGGAGLAMRGDARNTWRSDAAFLAAKAAPVGSPLRRGKWAVFGVARGPMRGREGRSYAVETIVRPGAKRSTPLDVIGAQLVELAAFAATRPDLVFLVTPLGEQYSGYSRAEMAGVWASAYAQRPFPVNLRFVRFVEDRPGLTLT